MRSRAQVISSPARSEEHTSELQSLRHLVCRLLLEKKKGAFRSTSQNSVLRTQHLLLITHYSSLLPAAAFIQFAEIPNVPFDDSILIGLTKERHYLVAVF